MEKSDCNYSIVIKDQDVLKDLSSLISLYGPVIGASAMSLYLVLINEANTLQQLNNPKFEFSRLYKISSLTEKGFNDAVKKLESLRLVKTKVSKCNGAKKYEIYGPLEANEFFENELFEKTLANKVGLENLESLKFLFKEKTYLDQEDDFEDVTAIFEDVFAEELDEISTSPVVDDSHFLHLRSSKKTILEKMLDVDLLTAILKKANIRLNYNARKIKKILNWALSIYNFNEQKLAKIIINNYDFDKGALDGKSFENQVRELVLLKKKTKEKQVPNQKTFFNTQEELTIQQISEVQIVNQKEPENLVRELTNNPPDLNIRRMIKVLLEKYNLEKGAINFLIDFSCFVNDHRIVVNYIYKIADSLKELGITQTTDTMIYLRQIKQKKESKKNNYFYDQAKINQPLQGENFHHPTYDEVLSLISKI